jgi:hypothetical protein
MGINELLIAGLPFGLGLLAGMMFTSRRVHRSYQTLEAKQLKEGETLLLIAPKKLGSEERAGLREALDRLERGEAGRLVVLDGSFKAMSVKHGVPVELFEDKA